MAKLLSANKLVILLFHFLLGGLIMSLGGVVGYLICMRFGLIMHDYEYIPFIGFCIGAVIALTAYIRRFVLSNDSNSIID